MEDNMSLRDFYNSLPEDEKLCLGKILELEDEKLNLSGKTEAGIVFEIKKIIEGEIK